MSTISFKTFIQSKHKEQAYIRYTNIESIKNKHPRYWIIRAFNWNDTEEGGLFWNNINKEWLALIKNNDTITFDLTEVAETVDTDVVSPPPPNNTPPVSETTNNLDIATHNLLYVNYETTAQMLRLGKNTGVINTPYGNHNPYSDITTISKTAANDGLWSTIGMHNHPNYSRMPGLGQFTLNVNGYMLQTRHNDYRLYKKTTGMYGITESIASVTNYSISEMKDLFLRYKNKQLTTTEKDLFRWDLTYIECFYMKLEDYNDNISDLFKSFRHSFPSGKVFDKFKLKMNSILTGKKDRFENNPLLPIIPIPDGGYAVLVYRMLTEPILEYNGKTYEDVLDKVDNYNITVPSITDVRRNRFRVKKDLWENIPGLDGRGSSITNLKTIDGYDIAGKNYAYYHRTYSLNLSDAVNLRSYSNSWSDPTLIVAHTTNESIFGGISYLLPIEMVLRTPLEEWNPYNVLVKNKKPSGNGSSSNPYSNSYINGYNFRIPYEFFTGVSGTTVADTSYNKYMTTSSGTKNCYASGIWVNLPTIKDVGVIRTRFPIFWEWDDYSYERYYLEKVRKQLQ